jgi:hypothetical protein
MLKHHGEKIMIDTSVYSDFERWIGYYKDVFEEVLVVEFDKLTKDTVETYKEICEFLGLEYQEVETDIYEESYKVKFEDKDKEEGNFGKKMKFVRFRIKRNVWKIISAVFTIVFGRSSFRD